MKKVCTVPIDNVPYVNHLTNPVSAQWHPRVVLIGGEVCERGVRGREERESTTVGLPCSGHHWCTYRTTRLVALKPIGWTSFTISRLAMHQDRSNFHASRFANHFLLIQLPFCYTAFIIVLPTLRPTSPSIFTASGH